LSWNEKVREIRRHLWGAGFNRSSEVHEGMSYWTKMRSIDRRFETLEKWEQASQEDAFFPLGIAWKPAGRTVGDVVEEMMAWVGPPPPTTVAHWVQTLSVLAAQGAKRAPSHQATGA
jgi:hypothetical protein